MGLRGYRNGWAQWSKQGYFWAVGAFEPEDGSSPAAGNLFTMPWPARAHW